ncbi:flagellar basal body P-ring formation chaperone FlgA [Salinisphaera aquimarina]|uniref:Flagella basal body P-ring formation protein FlgA n=1 Tax=Salinisphaera aquimarina TaxID=2094031 RepID=A0ABV7EN67_9GAMM
MKPGKSGRITARATAARGLAGLFLWCLTGAAAANSSLSTTLEDSIVSFLEAHSDAAPEQLHIAIAESAARMGPCRAPEPFLPGRSQRVAGRLTVGVRCPGDAPSLRYYQADVAVEAPYYVATRTIDPGETIRPADLRQVTGEITRLAGNVATRADELVGRVAVRRIAADLPLRVSMVAEPRVIERGAHVRVISRGNGFSITTEGKALDSATRGGRLRVSTDGGAVVRGMAEAANTVVVGR